MLILYQTDECDNDTWTITFRHGTRFLVAWRRGKRALIFSSEEETSPFLKSEIGLIVGRHNYWAMDLPPGRINLGPVCRLAFSYLNCH